MYIVIGLNASLSLSKQTTEWAAAGTDRKNVHTILAFSEEVDTSIHVEAVLDWIVLPAVPDQILESIKNLIDSIDGT